MVLTADCASWATSTIAWNCACASIGRLAGSVHGMESVQVGGVDWIGLADGDKDGDT